MNFEGLKNRVDRAEALVEGRLIQTGDRYSALKSSWRQAWTPSRIVIAGLVAGLVAGATQPQRALRRLGKLGGPKSLQMISAVSGLMTSIQATIAAATAEKAAKTADEAADTADDAAETAGVAATRAQTQTAAPAAAGTPAPPAAVPAPAPPDDVAMPAADRRRPEPAYAEQPRPAEAATELSESGR